MKFIYPILLVVFSSSAISCSCKDEPSLEEAVKLNKYVFIAEVSAPTKKNSESMITKYDLLHLENIKGTPTTQYIQEEFEIKTSCSVTLNQGDKCLIFLNSDEPNIDLGGCGASLPLKYLDREVKDWRRRVKNSSQKSVIDAKDTQHN